MRYRNGAGGGTGREHRGHLPRASSSAGHRLTRASMTIRQVRQRPQLPPSRTRDQSPGLRLDSQTDPSPGPGEGGEFRRLRLFLAKAAGVAVAVTLALAAG